MLYNWLNLTQMEWLFSWVGLGVLEMRIKTKITASHTLNEKTNKQTNKKKTNMKVIFTVMNTTCAVVRIRPEKRFRPVRDLNPWPLRYQSSALPTELTRSYFHHCSSNVFIRSSNIWLSYIYSPLLLYFTGLFGTNKMTSSQLAC